MDAEQFAILWLAIKTTPFPFVAGFFLISGAIWWIINTLYSSRNDTQTHRLSLKDDEIARLEKALSAMPTFPSAAEPLSGSGSLNTAGDAGEIPLLHLKIADEKKEGRTFLPEGRIFELLTGCRSQTAVEASISTKVFVGNWLSVTSPVVNVHSYDAYMTVAIDTSAMSGAPSDQEIAIGSLEFQSDFEALRMLRKGDIISVVGQLHTIDAIGFVLKNCEFVVAHPR